MNPADPHDPQAPVPPAAPPPPPVDEDTVGTGSILAIGCTVLALVAIFLGIAVIVLFGNR
jgi:hypothetical protein